MSEKHTLSVVVENHFGVLARVAGLISARGFNIDSLTVSETEDPTVSRMTIVVDADTTKLEQVKNQLNRLIDVIEIHELREQEFVDRELLLARVKAAGAAKGQVERLAKEFGARLTQTSNSGVVIEAVGTTHDLDRLVEALRPHGIQQLVRTGRIALQK